jgi:hypothetical protein
MTVLRSESKVLPDQSATNLVKSATDQKCYELKLKVLFHFTFTDSDQG